MSLLYIAIVLVGFLGDRLVKDWAAGTLVTEHGGSMPLISDVFQFTYCENQGMAFSMLDGKTWLLIATTGVICLVGIYFLFLHKKVLPPMPSVCLAMALSGALGNLYDRIILHYVVDMLDFCLINFAIFNVADCLICIGIIGFGIWYVFYEEKHKGKLKDRWTGKNKKLPEEP